MIPVLRVGLSGIALANPYRLSNQVCTRAGDVGGQVGPEDWKTG